VSGEAIMFAENCVKLLGSQGSARNPAGGDYSGPPTLS